MRYHYEKPDYYAPVFEQRYFCNHPIYNVCTLYLIDDRGLAVIQQRYDATIKATWWTDIDPYLDNDIYLANGFREYFDKYAAPMDEEKLYPTVTVRQIMHALHLKPLKKEIWETLFDHAPI